MPETASAVHDVPFFANPAHRLPLVCPVCHVGLSSGSERLDCPTCRREFPIVNGVPVLINETSSVFRIRDFVEQKDTFFRSEPWVRRAFFAILPATSINRVARSNYARMAALLSTMESNPRVLVLGGSIMGAGMEEFRARLNIEFIDTDVSFGPLTKVICDAHEIPLPDHSVNGVVAQAVLEHVADPQRCVQEICRVLKPGGILYAETPFMQPAHATPYDFHRFTFIGYRRLFRQFEQIALGPVGGPGQALGVQYENFLLCFSRNRAVRAFLYVAARWSAFWLKYLDAVLNKSPHAIHCAFGLYFLGRRTEQVLSDREVLDCCRKMC